MQSVHQSVKKYVFLDLRSFDRLTDLNLNKDSVVGGLDANVWLSEGWRPRVLKAEWVFSLRVQPKLS